jgi:phospholipase/carboxylesterase
MSDEVSRTDSTAIMRMPVQTSSYHAVQVPVSHWDTTPPPTLLLAMHGYGQACKNFIRTFSPFAEQNILVVAPQGLHQFYWSNHRPAFSWMTSFEREQTITDNLAYMAQLYDTLQEEYTFDPERVFLLGFSQGVAMAFRFATAGHITPRGVIACGGDLPPDVADRIEEVTPFPAMVMHGTEDTIVPIEKSEACVEVLEQHQFPVETHFFEGTHEIPDAQVEAIGQWIKNH